MDNDCIHYREIIMLTIRPTQLNSTVLLTAISPISHFDPGVGKGGNTLSFNRRKQVVNRSSLPATFDAAAVATIVSAFPAPVPLVGVFEQLTATWFTAAAILKTFLDAHNTADGLGHFQVDRYDGFTNRVQHASLRSDLLFTFWSRLSNLVGVGATGEQHDNALHALWSLPMGVQARIVRSIEKDHIALVSLARAWHNMGKMNQPEYAAKAGRNAIPQTLMSYGPESDEGESAQAVIEVPYISSNDIRHHIRAAGWAHLVTALGIKPVDIPGYGDIPHPIAALFENGGNLEQGAKQPGDAYVVSHEIRGRYPLISLLGGNLVSFDLGESDLTVRAEVVCQENGPFAEGVKVAQSIFDMLDDVTETRHASQAGIGQMIRNFETMVKGTQVQVVCSLNPFASELVQGCLVAALLTWMGRCHVAGQKARGYGHFAGEVIEQLPDAAANLGKYETYLKENAAALRDGLLDGTLGTSRVLAR